MSPSFLVSRFDRPGKFPKIAATGVLRRPRLFPSGVVAETVVGGEHCGPPDTQQIQAIAYTKLRLRFGDELCNSVGRAIMDQIRKDRRQKRYFPSIGIEKRIRTATEPPVRRRERTKQVKETVSDCGTVP